MWGKVVVGSAGDFWFPPNGRDLQPATRAHHVVHVIGFDFFARVNHYHRIALPATMLSDAVSRDDLLLHNADVHLIAERTIIRLDFRISVHLSSLRPLIWVRMRYMSTAWLKILVNRLSSWQIADRHDTFRRADPIIFQKQLNLPSWICDDDVSLTWQILPIRYFIIC